MKAGTFAVVMFALWMAADATELLVTPTVLEAPIIAPVIAPIVPVLETVPLPVPETLPGHNVQFCLRNGIVVPCLKDEIPLPLGPLVQEKILLEPSYYPYNYNPLYEYNYPYGYPYGYSGIHEVPLVTY